MATKTLVNELRKYFELPINRKRVQRFAKGAALASTVGSKNVPPSTWRLLEPRVSERPVLAESSRQYSSGQLETGSSEIY
jgi:hypothetical protein